MMTAAEQKMDKNVRKIKNKCVQFEQPLVCVFEMLWLSVSVQQSNHSELNHIIIVIADTIDHNKVMNSGIISSIIESGIVAARDNFTVDDDSIDTTNTTHAVADDQWKWRIDVVVIMMEPRKLGRSRLRSRLFQDRFYEDQQGEFEDLEQ